LRFFGKPTSREYRRMGVTLAYNTVGSNVLTCVDQAKEMAALVTVKNK